MRDKARPSYESVALSTVVSGDTISWSSRDVTVANVAATETGVLLTDTSGNHYAGNSTDMVQKRVPTGA